MRLSSHSFSTDVLVSFTHSPPTAVLVLGEVDVVVLETQRHPRSADEAGHGTAGMPDEHVGLYRFRKSVMACVFRRAKNEFEKRQLRSKQSRVLTMTANVMSLPNLYHYQSVVACVFRREKMNLKKGNMRSIQSCVLTSVPSLVRCAAVGRRPDRRAAFSTALCCLSCYR